MDAAEYLSAIAGMKAYIEDEKEMMEEYLNKADSMSMMPTNIKVQSSQAYNSRLEKYVVLAADLQRKIQQDQLEYSVHYHDVADQIAMLNDAGCVQILFKVYLQGKSIRQAGDEMGRGYTSSIILHKKALERFEEIHAETIAEWEKDNAGKYII